MDGPRETETDSALHVAGVVLIARDCHLLIIGRSIGDRNLAAERKYDYCCYSGAVN